MYWHAEGQTRSTKLSKHGAKCKDAYFHRHFLSPTCPIADEPVLFPPPMLCLSWLLMIPAIAGGLDTLTIASIMVDSEVLYSLDRPSFSQVPLGHNTYRVAASCR